MAGILKTLAVAASAGAAFGLCAGAAGRRSAKLPADDDTQSRIDAQQAEIENLRALVDQHAAGIEKAIELKVSARIEAIERALVEQSASIDSLRDRALDTDANLKRLITAIERLCDRTQPVASTPASAAVLSN